ncbi:hypothetical protein ACFWF7_07575 [Nocardia sp. NPDC060256]|uniref:hypothetical protein n=1 Tax=unclassified Nocardia TaxID=2637762 RepID=UPI00364B804E
MPSPEVGRHGLLGRLDFQLCISWFVREWDSGAVGRCRPDRPGIRVRDMERDDTKK